MITLNIVTLKNSERNLHRIFVTFKNVEYDEEVFEDYNALIYQARKMFYRVCKATSGKRHSRILSYEFEEGRSSGIGKQTFVVELKNATTEDSRMLASMIYTAINTYFNWAEGEDYKIGRLNLDFIEIGSANGEKV